MARSQTGKTFPTRAACALLAYFLRTGLCINYYIFIQ